MSSYGDYTTLAELFIYATDKFADEVAYRYKVGDEWKSVTFNQVRKEVEEIAGGLKRFGFEPNDHVGIMAENSRHWAMIDYATLCSRGTLTTIYPSLTTKQAKWIILHSECKFLFCGTKHEAEKILPVFDSLPRVEKVFIINDDSVEHPDFIPFSDLVNEGKQYISQYSDEFKKDVKSVKPEDLATLIYTSGTTGVPKGVMLTHKNIVANVLDSLQALDISINDSMLSFLPLSHSFERTGGHFCPFAEGATVCYAENLLKVAENIVEVSPTVMMTVPRLLEKIYTKINSQLQKESRVKQNIFQWARKIGEQVFKAENSGEKIGFFLKQKYNLANKLVFSKIKEKVGGKLRYMVSGGAPLPRSVALFLNSIGITVQEGYGLTETAPVLSANRLGENKIGTVGPPLETVRIRIAPDGELLVKGPNVMKGYYKNKEETRKAIDEEGWFHTGDIAEIDEDGYIKITDRKKHIIVTAGGKNVAPQQLEGILVTSKWIEQVVIVGDDRKYLGALVVPAFPNLEEWAEENGYEWETKEDLISIPEVKAIYDEVIKNSMDSFAQFERVRKYKLLTNEFTIEDGELTPSLKIKRNVVLDKYSDLIDAMYNI
ncbi:MAG: long-chain fatty acid--CoA ligase [Candidatus Marinimicrobia bacterium]|nr:long-chain fatty acid--CoA ligase [Candidatus Neomarinimicrobiota bacterium]